MTPESEEVKGGHAGIFTATLGCICDSSAATDVKIALEANCSADAKRGQSSCRLCAIRALTIFRCLKLSDLDRVEPYVDDMQFMKGHAIFREGEEGNWIFSVKTGSLKVLRRSQDGHFQINRILVRGSAIGLESLLPNPVYANSVFTIEDARVCRIPAQVIRGLAEESSELRDELQSRWAQAVLETEDWAAMRAFGSPGCRFARLLLKLAHVDFYDVFYLPKRADLGNVLGISMETASRVVAEFRRKGLLRHTGFGRYQINRIALINYCKAGGAIAPGFSIGVSHG